MGHAQRVIVLEQVRTIREQGRGGFFGTEKQLRDLWSCMELLEEWMTDINTALADLSDAINGVSQRASDTQSNLQSQIDALKAAGTDTTQLQAVADALEQHVADLNAIDPQAAVADTGATDAGATATDPSAPAPTGDNTTTAAESTPVAQDATTDAPADAGAADAGATSA